jgi:hypothetical protein
MFSEVSKYMNLAAKTLIREGVNSINEDIKRYIEKNPDSKELEDLSTFYIKKVIKKEESKTKKGEKEIDNIEDLKNKNEKEIDKALNNSKTEKLRVILDSKKENKKAEDKKTEEKENE